MSSPPSAVLISSGNEMSQIQAVHDQWKVATDIGRCIDPSYRPGPDASVNEINFHIYASYYVDEGRQVRLRIQKATGQLFTRSEISELRAEFAAHRSESDSRNHELVAQVHSLQIELRGLKQLISQSDSISTRSGTTDIKPHTVVFHTEVDKRTDGFTVAKQTTFLGKVRQKIGSSKKPTEKVVLDDRLKKMDELREKLTNGMG